MSVHPPRPRGWRDNLNGGQVNGPIIKPYCADPSTIAGQAKDGAIISLNLNTSYG